MPEENPVDPSEAMLGGAPAGPPAPPPPPPPTAAAEPEKDWTNEDPAKDLTKAPTASAHAPAYLKDPAFFRLVITFSGWVLILSVGGMLLLAANDKEIPQGVVAAASGLVGLLTGIFAAKSSET